MKRAIVGVVITAVIGGTTYTISQSDEVKNFSKNSGLSQENAQKYVETNKNSLASFEKVGGDLVAESANVSGKALAIDCVNYRYTWETASLGCDEGKSEIQDFASTELNLGQCYLDLGTDLGSIANQRIKECIRGIERYDAGLELPIVRKFLSAQELLDAHRTNQYNKAVLQSAILQK